MADIGRGMEDKMALSRRLLLSALPPLLLVATLPWVLSGAAAVDCNTSGLTQWLPDQHPERYRYQQFVDQFGADDFVIVSWPGCTLADQRLDQLVQALEATAGSDAPSEQQRLFDSILTGPRLLERLESAPLNLSHAEGIRRLSGFVVGPDQKTTCAILKLSPHGQVDQKRVIRSIERVAVNLCGLSRDNLRMGVPLMTPTFWILRANGRSAAIRCRQRLSR